MRRRTLLATAATVLATPLVAGCSRDDGGGDGGGGGGGENDGLGGYDLADPGDAIAAVEPSGEFASQATLDQYDWSRLSGVDLTETSTVHVRGGRFAPAVATVAAGTAVRFVNEDAVPHAVTVPGLGVDEQVRAGGSASVTFDRAGTFEYVGRFHPPDMVGRVVVE